MRVPRAVPRDASSQLASPILAVTALKVIEIGSQSERRKMERFVWPSYSEQNTLDLLIYKILLYYNLIIIFCYKLHLIVSAKEGKCIDKNSNTPCA